MKKETTIWLYKEYNDELAYGEEMTRLFPAEETAKEFLKKQVKEAYGLTLEELRKDPDFQYDSLDDDHVTIVNDGGDTSYFWIEKKKLEEDENEVGKAEKADVPENENINFLKDLQHEMLTQDTCCQAWPRYWVIREPHREYGVDKEYADGYLLRRCDGEGEAVYNMEDAVEFLEEFRDELLDGSNASELQVEYDGKHLIGRLLDDEGNVDWEDTFRDLSDVCESINECCAEEVCELVGYRNKWEFARGPLFLTLKAAEEYLKKYGYNHPEGSHPYALTAHRSPEVEKVWKFIETADWNKIAEAIK